MSNIVIRDLDESKELDANAMSKISGGRFKLSNFFPSAINNSRLIDSPHHPDGSPMEIIVDGLSRRPVSYG